MRQRSRNIRAHRVYMARRFLARSPTTVTVTALPPVNQGFYSLPRLNQRIALNGALLVIPSPSYPFLPVGRPLAAGSRMNYSYARLNSARGSGSLEVSHRNAGPDYNSAHRATRAPKTPGRHCRIRARWRNFHLKISRREVFSLLADGAASRCRHSRGCVQYYLGKLSILFTKRKRERERERESERERWGSLTSLRKTPGTRGMQRRNSNYDRDSYNWISLGRLARHALRDV